MPQTYIRARPDVGPIGTTSRRRVSKAWTGSSERGPGSRGTGWALQDCMAVTLSVTESPSRSERGPWDRRPLPARPGQSFAVQQQVGTADEGPDLPLVEQLTQSLRCLV